MKEIKYKMKNVMEVRKKASLDHLSKVYEIGHRAKSSRFYETLLADVRPFFLMLLLLRRVRI